VCVCDLSKSEKDSTVGRERERERERKRERDRPLYPLAPRLPLCGSLTCGALAVEGVDLVDTVAVVQAGAVGALVRIDLAELPLVTWPISKGGPGGRWIG